MLGCWDVVTSIGLRYEQLVRVYMQGDKETTVKIRYLLSNFPTT